MIPIATGARVMEHRPVWRETIVDVPKLGALGRIREDEDGVGRVARNDAARLHTSAVLHHEVSTRDDVTSAEVNGGRRHVTNLSTRWTQR